MPTNFEACDASQLVHAQWVTEFIQVFKKNNSLHLIKEPLVKLLCSHHSHIPSNALDAILSTSPNEKKLSEIEYDDDEDDDIEEPLTFIQQVQYIIGLQRCYLLRRRCFRHQIGKIISQRFKMGGSGTSKYK